MLLRIVTSRVVWVSVPFILFAILLPLWLKPEHLGLFDRLASLEMHPSGNLLMVTVFLLMVWKVVFTLPYYIGCFLLADQIGERTGVIWLKTVLPLLLFPLLPFEGHLYRSVGFQVGMPDVMLLLSIVLLQRLGKDRLGLGMKSLVLTQLLIGFQWLLVVPFLSFLDFGHYPAVAKLKEIAVHIGFDKALGLYGVVLCLIFIVNAAILAAFLTVAGQKWKMTETLHLAQLEAIQSRSGREVLQLVHDLKTPLTSIEGLISLIGMRIHDAKVKEYCAIISNSIGSMSEMISEMLYEDRKNWCSLHELMNYVRASRLSGTGASVEIELPEQNVYIWVNKIRVTRAIVNLIDNALDAIKNKTAGKVVLRARINANEIWIGVSDNGNGITMDEQAKIWQAGYSTKKNPGLGLSFVRQVAEGHNAMITIESEVGSGTTVWLHLHGGDEWYENISHR